MEQPTPEQSAHWESLLLGFDLGMARGIGRLQYGWTYYDTVVAKPFDYVRRHQTVKQATTRNRTLEGSWGTGSRHTAESIQKMSDIHKAMDHAGRFKPGYQPSEATRRKMSEAAIARSNPMVNLCGHPEKPHLARAKCAACYHAWLRRGKQ